jgi:hypothetical protein
VASAFCVYEMLVENYGKHLAHSDRSTPLSALMFSRRQPWSLRQQVRLPTLIAGTTSAEYGV